MLQRLNAIFVKGIDFISLGRPIEKIPLLIAVPTLMYDPRAMPRSYL
jgi:hypothetical protein